MNIHTFHFGTLNSVLEKLEQCCPYLFIEHFDLEKLDSQYLHLLGPGTSSSQLKDIQKSLIEGTIETTTLKKIIEIEICALCTSMNTYGTMEGYYILPRLLNDSKDFSILSELGTLLGIVIPGLDKKIQELIDQVKESSDTLL